MTDNVFVGCPYCNAKNDTWCDVRDLRLNIRTLWRCKGCGRSFMVNVSASVETITLSEYEKREAEAQEPAE